MSEVADQLAVTLKQAALIEEIREHAQSLELAVEARTLELEEANGELEAFAYSVSHDLRAPLRAMQGFGQALIEDHGETMDATARDFTRRIVQASAHMDEIIQDLLAYSRVARADLRPEAVAITEATNDALAQLDEDIDKRGAIVSVKCGKLEITAHRQTVVQVIANLVSNGIKFVPPGETPVIGISAARHNGNVCLKVSDNGIGIEARHLERIFGLFERLHGMEEYPGTGIGLAIVKKGTERMGGSVGLESTIGEGSTFWVELPSA